MKFKSGVKLPISFFILALIINTVNSQEVRNISNFKYFEYKDGLSENDVKEFIPDKENGYWFRASSSVIYFNGYEFTNYKKENKLFHLENAKVFSFNFYRNHIYVFGNNGVDMINWKTKESRCIYTHRNPYEIRAGFITSRGHILIITSDGTIFQLEGNQLKKVGSITYYTQCTIRETDEGNILISNDKKELMILNSNLSLIKKYRESFDLIPPGIYSRSSYGTVIATNQGSYQYHQQTRGLLKVDGLASLTRLFCESGQYFYTVSKFNKIVQQHKASSSVTNVNILLNNNYYINHISADHQSSIVLCTNQGVLIFNELNNSFHQLPYPIKQNDAEGNTKRTLLETKDHKILQLTYKWIALYDPITFYNKLITLSDYNSYSGLLDGDNLWIGTDGQGLIRVNLKDSNMSAKNRYIGKGADIEMHITTLNKFNDQYLILGTSISNVSLKLFDVKQKEFKDVVIQGWPGGVIKDKVSSIVDAKFGGKWICTNNGLIHISDNFEITRWIGNKELGTGLINHVYEDDSKNIWIATDHGVFVYDLTLNQVSKKITFENGLAGNKCISIIPDHYNTLWVPTYTGLSRIDLKSESVNNYYIHDGLSDNEYNYSSFLKTSSGDIYLGGLNNYVQIKPLPFEADKNVSVKLSLDYIHINNSGVDSLVNFEGLRPISFHYKDDRLHFTFSLKNQLFSEFVIYQYRIKGLNDKWISLNRQNSILLGRLPPGNYTLEIQSTDIRNRLNVQKTEIPLSVYAYFYETDMFYFLVAAFVIGLIISIFIIRIKALKKIGRLKTDLSNDIHDEIGTIFTKAVMQLDMLDHKAGKAYPEIKTIERSLRDGIQRFRNVLWSLNTDHGKSDDFAARINTTISEIFSDTRFDFRVTNKSMNVYFNKSIRVRRNLLLIIRELAHNTLKHSNGNLFEVVISKESNKWVLKIFDNGTNGPDTLDGRDIGLGLKSINSRVASFKGNIHLENSINGFYIKIII